MKSIALDVLAKDTPAVNCQNWCVVAVGVSLVALLSFLDDSLENRDNVVVAVVG